MAELKNPPSCLKVIEIISTVMLIIAIIGLLFGVMAFFNDSVQSVSLLALGIGSCTSYAVLSGLYYIVKAACIYIEKEESEE